MKRFLGAFLLITFAWLTGCHDPWEDIVTEVEKIDQNLWDVIKSDTELATFVDYMEANQLDTLFEGNTPYTVFALSNEALENYSLVAEVDTSLLKYHIYEFLIQSSNTQGTRKIRTLNRKIAVFNKSSGIYFDGHPLVYESPLYRNGKYFIMDEVAEPKPNLYDYFAKNNLVLKEYIDSQDSLALDLERSVPIGFDADGNTIYDTVSLVYNRFFTDYFEFREEFRNKRATVVFPLAEDYENALTIMAQNMNSVYVDHTDIPKVWQEETLIPYLVDKGLFENLMEPGDFFKHPEKNGIYKVKNILGDSVEISYSPVDKFTCSNGYAYNYANFEIPDSLYNTANRFEAETLLEESGFDKYNWKEEVNVVSDIALAPYREFIGSASNDSILRVLFPPAYDGTYSVEFDSQNLFPRKYLMVIRTHMDYGGIYDIYVNDELIRTFDYRDFSLYPFGLPSVNGEDYYILEGRFNRFDMYVDNITTFGKAKIRFDYKEPGQTSSNGLVVDYIDFVPVN